MHGDVALVTQEGIAQRRDEHARAAHLRQRACQDVAVGPDVDQFHRETADGGQLVRCLLGLGERELAGAGPDTDGHRASCPAAGAAGPAGESEA